jgi:hypothetical protein
MTRVQKHRLSLFLIAGLLALLAVGALLSYGSIASLSKSAVERLASHDLGVKVRIQALHIDPENKLVTIQGVTIDNPKGYKKAPAIIVGTVDIDARSLQRELLAFDDIRVTGMNMRVEVSEDGTNLSALRDIVAHHVSRLPSQKVKTIKVELDHIVFSGTRIEPAAVTEAIAKDLSPKILPEMHLRGIGHQGAGLSLPDAVSQILAHVINVALRASADAGYLDSLSPEEQRRIGARLNAGEQFFEDAKAAINKAPSDVEALKKGVEKAFKVNE